MSNNIATVLSGVDSDDFATLSSAAILASETADVCYDTLIDVLGIDVNVVDNDSAYVTAAARAIVMAAFPDVTIDRLKGANKGHDEAWRRARAVRINLVNAAKRAADEPEKGETPDVALITRAGAKATLEDVMAAWHAAQK